MSKRNKISVEYRQTEIGTIPKEWEVVRLGEYIDVYSGYAFKRQDFSNNNTAGVPIIKIGNLQNGSIRIDEHTSYVSEKFYKSLPDFQLYPGDVLIALSGATTGKISVVHKDIGLMLVNQRVGKFKILNTTKIYQFFFYYLAQSNIFKRFVIQNIGQSAQGNLSPTQLKKSLIPLPPLPEQKKIAEILSTVDEVIEKVDKAIEKTERLKKGLMQELLTGRKRVKGFVGLRVNGVGKKEEYKDTEIGRIPKEWEIGFLGFVESVGFIESQLCEIIMGQSPPSTTYNKEQKGLPFLQGKMEFGELYPNPSIYCSQPIKIAEKNDILISVRAPVGEVNISTGKVCIGRGLAAIRCNPYKLYHLFLFYYLKHFGKKLSNISVGSTFKSIRKEELSNFAIPLPPLPEQKKIVEFLSSVDKKLELLHNRKNRYEKVKKGLMNDLLTGKRRVKVNKALNSKSEILNKSK